MDLELDAATREFREDVRGFLAASVPPGPLPSMDTAPGFEAHREWERVLSDARLSAVSWPAEFGGRGASLLAWIVFEHEYHAAGAPQRVNQNGLSLLAPTLYTHATPDQQRRLLPAIARSDTIWAQTWSEPDAGSDLAALRSRAVRVPGGWRLNGHKTWASRAAFADAAFGLFRTGTIEERHRGLTYFLYDLRAPGVLVRPIPQLDGEPGFAEVFLDDVFVPDADLVGAVGDGWRVAMSTVASERGLSLRSPGRFLASVGRLIALWSGLAEPTGTATADRVVDAWIGARAYELHTLGAVTRTGDGEDLGSEASMGKLFWSELDVRIHQIALDLLGPDAELRGDWLDGYLFSLAGPIYAGTNEIQRNIVAERLLGLPR